GSLLIRSPQSQLVNTNIDIICTGVEFISAPRFLRGLEILEPRADELDRLQGILGKPVSPSSVRILAASGQRFMIVAAVFQVEENEKEIFDSPFEHGST